MTTQSRIERIYDILNEWTVSNAKRDADAYVTRLEAERLRAENEALRARLRALEGVKDSPVHTDDAWEDDPSYRTRFPLVKLAIGTHFRGPGEDVYRLDRLGDAGGETWAYCVNITRNDYVTISGDANVIVLRRVQKAPVVAVEQEASVRPRERAVPITGANVPLSDVPVNGTFYLGSGLGWTLYRSWGRPESEAPPDFVLVKNMEVGTFAIMPGKTPVFPPLPPSPVTPKDPS